MSYQSDDVTLAKALKDALASKGHDVRLDTESGASDDWRRVPNDELAAADAVVFLLSEKALGSHFMMSEIGAARVFGQTRGTRLIPVIVGDLPVPQIISDLSEVRLRDNSQQKVADTAKSIERELSRHFKRLPAKWPQIFISHRHKDTDVASALTDLLEAYFNVESGDIRCTSVDPYRLKTGERTADRLRAEISRAKVVLGILTPDTKESSYVMFELGASWGQQVSALPLLAKGATAADVPAPIGDLTFVQLADESDCRKLMYDLPQMVGLLPREGAAMRINDRVRELARRAQASENAEAKKSAASKKRAVTKRSASTVVRARTSAKKNGNAVVAKKLKALLKDPKHPSGRYIDTLCEKTGLTENKCRKQLVELGARQVKLKRGEGWTLKRRK
jgi:hypothetical protein